MIESAYYLVSREIAIRSGLLNDRYRVSGGRFILDNKDLSRIRFSPNEYLNGLEGLEQISLEQAKTLIAANGYKMGDNGEDVDVEVEAVEDVANDESQEQEPTTESDETSDANEEQVLEEESQEETNETTEE